METSTTSEVKKTGWFTARNASQNALVENVKTLAIAIVFALIFRSFLFEPFHIPSGSMKSNLLIGDYIFVSKFSYGYSRYSFPFSFPLFEGRVWQTLPKRGDIVVFRPPGRPKEDYIKRLIGMPGDRIQMKEGLLYINDKAIERKFEDEWTDNDKPSYPDVLKRYQETLPEGVTHLASYETPLGPMENTDVYTVPAGHYFMMGDNRDHSRDSRYADPVGFVPLENLVGRAEIVFFSWENGLSFRGDRFFHKLTN